MSSDVRKRVVIVTGASRGLGKEIALTFGRAGDRVVVNYRNSEQKAFQVVDTIVASGGEAVSRRADIGVSREVDGLVADAVERWGAVDVLVNNAGITRDGIAIKMAEQDWDDLLRTNLSAAFYTIRAASRVMCKQRNGHVLNIASIVGMQGREGQANYSAAKAGLVGLTKAAARELGSYNVKVNAVLPGYLPTDMGDKVSSSILNRVLRDSCLNRISDAREVAKFVHYLSGMENVSGQVFNLDSRIL